MQDLLTDAMLTVSTDFASPSSSSSIDSAAARPMRQRRRPTARRPLATADAAAMGSSSTSSRTATTKKTKKAAAVNASSTPARCGYRTGKCPNMQAVKRNGKLHKLCEFHREKANMNQKKLDRKKRMQRSSSRLPFDALDASGLFLSPHSSEDEYSPRAIDVDPLLAMLEDDDDDEQVGDKQFEQIEVLPVLPTSLNEAPLSLGYEELAIFYSLMTFDRRQQLQVRQPHRHHVAPAYIV